MAFWFWNVLSLDALPILTMDPDKYLTESNLKQMTFSERKEEQYSKQRERVKKQALSWAPNRGRGRVLSCPLMSVCPERSSRVLGVEHSLAPCDLSAPCDLMLCSCWDPISRESSSKALRMMENKNHCWSEKKRVPVAAGTPTRLSQCSLAFCVCIAHTAPEWTQTGSGGAHLLPLNCSSLHSLPQMPTQFLLHSCVWESEKMGAALMKK